MCVRGRPDEFLTERHEGSKEKQKQEKHERQFNTVVKVCFYPRIVYLPLKVRA